MSYRPMIIGRAQDQFADLIDRPNAYDAFMERVIRLVDSPWDGPDDWLPPTNEREREREAS